MNFNADKPIYLQIADRLCDRIPSVREYGAEIDINPNTVIRSYDKLLSEEIFYNKRGIGYFVAPDAREKVLATQRETFLREELPLIRRRMQLLGLDESVFNQ